MHTDDQSRVKQIRNPLVEIMISGNESVQGAKRVKEMCLRNNIDVLLYRGGLNEEFPTMSLDDAKQRVLLKMSDFVIFIESNNIVLLPEAVAINQNNMTDVIHRRWDSMNNNLSPEQIELMSVSDLENVISRLTSLDNISATVNDLQNEAANILTSFSLADCKVQNPQIVAFRQKLLTFFGKLNLANSVIADMPLYSNSTLIPGTILQGFMPPPNGLSPPMQRVLSYLIGTYLTQIHVCLSQMNKLLNEYSAAPTVFATASSNPNAVHPTPLCALPFSLICTDDFQRQRMEYGRRIEPDANVDMQNMYSITFRESNGFYSNPLNQFPPNQEYF